MPPPLLMDLSQLDLSTTLLSREEIYGCLPQDHEFRVIDGVLALDKSARTIVCYADIREDAWWVRGHLPNRPLLPGVILIEMAAQTCAIGVRYLSGHEGFLGFGGINNCKFRESVIPPSRVLILSKEIEFRKRRSISVTQGVVDGRLVFEAEITGVWI